MLTSVELTHYDLVTPDGVLSELHMKNEKEFIGTVFIENISPNFVGYEIDPSLVFFNLKSALAQLGLDGIGTEYELDPQRKCAQVKVSFFAKDALAAKLLQILPIGGYVGKLFAADDRRRVRNPHYLSRMFGRSDHCGEPLLSLGGLQGSTDLILDKVDGRTVAYLSLQNGRIYYEKGIEGLLPTIAKALPSGLPLRDLVRLHQELKPFVPRNVKPDEILLVKTLPLHILTVFAKVVDDLLSDGYKHTSASVLQPDTSASGDTYELYGESKRELTVIPMEFYTLEPYREYVFFEDRDQLQACIEDDQALFTAAQTAPLPQHHRASVFIVKGQQLLNLQPEDWNIRKTYFHEFPGTAQSHRQALMVERYIEQQPEFPFLKSMSDNIITSQGILLSRYFPSPLMKRMLLSDRVQHCLQGIYFQYPSLHHQDFFSAEDRALLNDLSSFGVPTFWIDDQTKKILQYIQRPQTDVGLFVPLNRISHYLNSSIFGIYGSNLITVDSEKEVYELLQGILNLRSEVSHKLLHENKPISLVTGGGPGMMETGNKIALDLGILSCAHIVDFRAEENTVVNEQGQNPYIEAKMTYRLGKLVERQAEFNLDFPIFLMGGIGTDFEYALEQVRRKVGSTYPTPCILFGPIDYWTEKISSPFKCNMKTGVIKGSEWLSNCFYCIQSAKQGLQVYNDFFTDKLSIGQKGPVYPRGFALVNEDESYS